MEEAIRGDERLGMSRRQEMKSPPNFLKEWAPVVIAICTAISFLVASSKLFIDIGAMKSDMNTSIRNYDSLDTRLQRIDSRLGDMSERITRMETKVSARE